MGWFDEQIRQRKRMDDELFRDSYDNIAHRVLGEPVKRKDLKTNIKNAIDEIFYYYNYPRIEVPHGISEPLDQTFSEYRVPAMAECLQRQSPGRQNLRVQHSQGIPRALRRRGKNGLPSRDHLAVWDSLLYGEIPRPLGLRGGICGFFRIAVCAVALCVVGGCGKSPRGMRGQRQRYSL